MTAETEWVTGDVSLLIGEQRVTLKLTVPGNPVKPQVMLPIFQSMANSFTGMGINASEQAGSPVSCKKGCAACCHQPIPVSEIEVYYFAGLIAQMPEPRRTIITDRFNDTFHHFEQTGWFDKLDAADTEENLEPVILEYFFQNRPCPFLEDNSCSIYEQRPIVCREYAVTSPASNCAHPVAATITQLALPLTVSDGVQQLSRGESMPVKKIIPLVSVLKLAAMYPENAIKRAGDEWLGQFF